MLLKITFFLREPFKTEYSTRFILLDPIMVVLEKGDFIEKMKDPFWMFLVKIKITGFTLLIWFYQN